jgi:hypothetical protein
MNGTPRCTASHPHRPKVLPDRCVSCYGRHGLVDGIRERNSHVIADTHGGHGWDNLARNASTSSRSALNRDPITTALREAFTNM